LQSLTKFYFYLKKNKFISQEFPEIIYFLQEIDECFKTCRRHATTHSKKVLLFTNSTLGIVSYAIIKIHCSFPTRPSLHINLPKTQEHASFIILTSVWMK